MDGTGGNRAEAQDREPGTARKLLLSLAALGASVAVAASGTYAAFSASVDGGHSVSTGVPQLVLGSAGAATNRLDVNATGLAPGEFVYRAFDVTNSGTTRFTAFTLSSVAGTSSLLDTDPVHGLTVRLQRCSVPWSESGSDPNYTYSCPGVLTEVLGPRPVVMAGQPLSAMASAVPGGTDHLLLTESLPATADNSFQGLTSALTFTVDAA